MLYGHADIVPVLRRIKSSLFTSIDRDLALHYDFRLGGYDLTGRGRHAQFFGGASYNLAGLETNGSNSYARVTIPSYGTNPFSLEIYFRPLSNQTNAVLSWGDTNTDSTPYLVLQRNGINPSMCRWYWGGAWRTSKKIKEDTYSHLVFAHDGTNANMYFEGRNLVTVSVAPTNPSSYIYIGCGLSGYLHLKLLFLKLYNRVLSPGEVFMKNMEAMKSYGKYY